MQKAVIFDYNRTIFNPDTEQLMPDALAVLKRLQQEAIPLFLVAKGTEEREKQIETLGLLPFFRTVTVNESKSADDYRACIDHCAPNTQFFAVGDRVKEEITHANSCGMITIWFQNGKFAEEQPQDESQMPQFIVKSLPEAADIILQQRPDAV